MSDATPARTILVSVLNYLKINDYRRASFERLVGSVPGITTYTQLSDLVRNNPQIFLNVTIAGGRPGLRLRDSFDGTLPPEPVVTTATDSLTAKDLDVSIAEPLPAAPTKVCHISTLIQRAAEASDPSDAEVLSRAAMQAANALCALKHSYSFQAPTDGVQAV